MEIRVGYDFLAPRSVAGSAIPILGNVITHPGMRGRYHEGFSAHYTAVGESVRQNPFDEA